jgi:DNA-binding beta-propeller fold protein YncE
MQRTQFTLHVPHRSKHRLPSIPCKIETDPGCPGNRFRNAALLDIMLTGSVRQGNHPLVEHNNTIRKLTPVGTNWVVTTLGGMSGFYATADGTGSAARFSNPAGLAVDSAGNVYVADFYFNTIRKGFPAPMILNAGFNLGQFGLNLTGPAGHLVVVEASSDLVSWLSIWTNTIAPDLNFSDAQNGVFSNRFYRARLP